MTTMTGDSQTEVNQSLIDSRLDTIDRALNGRMPRRERLAIVREVEGQIHEMLGQRRLNTLEPGNILDVLARLDPPEAYLAQSSGEPNSSLGYPASPMTYHQSPTRGSGSALASGVLGILAMTVVMVTLFLVIIRVMDSEIWTYCVFLGLELLLAILAVLFGVRARLQETWSVVGLVTGILGFMIFMLGITALINQLGHAS